jgi:D-alanyl-D-alanine carboxypeptidase/D-alanyl-D-alanine-endopeptidase (penicillin-binding protein 4)
MLKLCCFSLAATVFLLSGLSACSLMPSEQTQYNPQQQLMELMTAQLQQAQLPADALAFIAYPLDQSTEPLAYQANRAMQPASTMKLLTSIAALELLGPAYRAKTHLLSYEAPVAQLQQPLVLKGYGDMDFTVEQLWLLLQQAYDLGIRRVPEIWIDRSWFQPARPELDALPFDETPREYYNLLPDALFLQRNMLTVQLYSDAHSVSGQLFPAFAAVRLDSSQVQLGQGDCRYWYPDPEHLMFKRQPDGLQLVLQGEFPQHCRKNSYIQVLNRVDFTRLMVQQVWQQISGQKKLQVREQQATEAHLVLAEHQSRTLAEVLREINKNSDNALTRQLYLSLGALAQQYWVGSQQSGIGKRFGIIPY